MMDHIPVIAKTLTHCARGEIVIHASGHIQLDTNALVSRSTNMDAVKAFSNVKGGQFDKLVCSHCDGPRHSVEKCYKLHGYPPNHPKYKSKQNQGKAHANQTRGFVSEPTPNTWELFFN